MVTNEIIARFWSYVDKNGPIIRPDLGPCWIWLRAKNDRGYGVGWDGKRTRLAHRMAWFLVKGEWPAQCACHACDNPPCCNPGHLFDDTRSGNLADMRAKGRGVNPPRVTTRGETHALAKLSEADAREIIRRGYAGEPGVLLAEEFHVTPSNVRSILNGGSWSHLERPAVRVRAKRRRR